MQAAGDIKKNVATWRRVVAALGYIAIALALLPSWSLEFGSVGTEVERRYLVENPSHAPSRREFRLGWPSSPLVRIYSQTALISDEKQSVQFHSGFRVGFITWSMAILILGIVLLKAARWQHARH